MTEDASALALRRRLYDAVVATPGLGARELQAAVGCAWGETTYHLLRLEEAGHLLRERGARQDFYFARAVAAGDRNVLRLAHSPTARQALLTLLEEPGLTLPQLADRTGAGSSRLRIELGRLRTFDLVRQGTVAEGSPWTIGDRRRVGDLLVHFQCSGFDAYLERLVGTWAELFGP